MLTSAQIHAQAQRDALRIRDAYRRRGRERLPEGAQAPDHARAYLDAIAELLREPSRGVAA